MFFPRLATVLPFLVWLLTVLRPGAGQQGGGAVAVCERSGMTIRRDDSASSAPNGGLTFGTWSYRESSTRPSWWVGCWLYDFLQASGIFPVTWFHDIDPLVGPELNSWVYLIDRSAYAGTYCAAEASAVNSLLVRYEQENLEGRIRVVPDFSASSLSADVTCAPEVLGIIDSPLFGDLKCELARLPFTGRECITLNVKLEGV